MIWMLSILPYRTVGLSMYITSDPSLFKFIYIEFMFADGEWKLLLIKQEHIVGILPNQLPIYKVDKVAVLSLTMDKTTDLEISVN